MHMFSQNSYIVKSLYYLNPKFPASSLLWLYSPVCVAAGRSDIDRNRVSHDASDLYSDFITTILTSCLRRERLLVILVQDVRDCW